MTKKIGSLKKQGIVLLCAASILFVGCGGNEAGSEQLNIESIEPSGDESGNAFVEETETSELEGTGVPDSADQRNADEADTEKAQALYAAQVRHYYGGMAASRWRVRHFLFGKRVWTDERQSFCGDRY